MQKNEFCASKFSEIDNMEKTPNASTCNPKGLSRGQLSNIEDGLELSVSDQAKERISTILENIESLSDVEKLLLYLKLPTGSVSEDAQRQTPTSFLHASNRLEQAQAFTWIRSHLEEDNQICVPKHEIYDDYRAYCESHELKPLCPADFGKVLKCIFPNVKPRRLGQRGQSRYCYSGLRKKLDIQPPSLPELEISPKKLKTEDLQESEMFSASCQLVCEWAGKLLSRGFTNLRELSEYLVGNLYVNSKSTAAFTVLAAMQEAGLQNSRVPVSPLFTCSSGGDKHRETQLQLQRKLQERELLKEQKKKLQQQRTEIEQEHIRSTSRGPSATPTKSPLPRSFSKTPTPIKSPVLRPPSSLSLKSPGPQLVAFRQTPTPTNMLPNASKCTARNITKLLQSPVLCGKNASHSQDIKTNPEAVEVTSASQQSDDAAILVSMASSVAQAGSITSVSSSFLSSSSSASAAASAKSTLSGISHMQVEGGSGESSLQEKSSQPAVLVPSVNGMNILSGGRQFIISGNQGLLLDDSMKNGLHLVQKPVVVSAGIPNSPNLPLSSAQQLQTVPVVSVSSSAPSLNSRKLLPFSATSMESLQVGQSITILSKSKENVSSENTCSEMESITAADVDRCRVDNANFIPGNLSSRSAFVPVSNQKLTITLATPSIGHTPQTSDSSGDEAPLPMDQSDIVGHSGGFEPHALDSRPVERPSNATTVSFSEASLSVQPHTTLSASSLQSTQKKVKNRFTPIRPKAPQTVTTFQKDQKTPEKDSRPVSALLKEKRAREAQEILAHIASSVQGQANSSKGFPASLSLPAEVLGISSDKASGQNDVVIFLTSPSTGSANFLASSRDVHISGEEKAIHEHDKSGVVTINMSDFQIANPNFIHSKDTQQTTLGQCHATEHALHMASQQVHDMPAISIFPAELQAVCGSQEIPSGKIRVDSGCVDASDSSEMGNTTDEEVTLHMDSGNATSIGLVSDNRGRDTPCRKRKSSGQESASQTNKRLNSSSKKNDAVEDDDVFIVEPSVSIQPHLGVGIVCEEDGGKQLLNRNIASILSRRVGLTSPIRCLQTSPVVMQVQTEESALMCRSTGIGTDDVTYSSVALLASSEFPGQVGTKLSVESLESDALLDSGLLPTGRELVSSSTSQQPAVHIGQKASVGISTKKLRAAQQDLLQQKPQLDARVSSYFSKGCGSQLTAQTIGQVSNFLFSSVTDSTTTTTTAGQDELTSVSRAGPGLLETMFRHSSDFLSLKNISSSTSIKIPDQISLPEVQQTRSVQSISMHGDAFNEDFQGNSSQLFEAGLIGNQEHASGKR
ncbi:uncharacterized protein LOC112558159 [Pomacea canaliculata]|uniref:uncharacterized protein LOC112558159 n=1 Tax=Pomacea canaliculata TaxID=400727 RepID=UPI000D733247|nr:uncharacterized protein LOC112558159 [Pomacea canaliculata]